jgi:HlyD family secretion protein
MLRLPKRSSKGSSSKDVAVADDTEALPLAVLEFQSPTASVIARQMPAVARYTTSYITLLIFSVLLVCCIKRVDKQVPTSGVLVSSAPDAVIQVLAASTVQDVKVHEGDIVSKGQVLVVLDKYVPNQDYTSLSSQEQNDAAQVAELQAQENGTPYRIDPNNPYSALQYNTYSQMQNQYKYTLEDYDHKISSLRQQIIGEQQQAHDYQIRLGTALQQVKIYQELYDHHVGSLIELQQAEDSAQALQAQLQAAQSAATSGAQDLASQQSERAGFDQQFRASISAQLATAQNNLAQAQALLAQAKVTNDEVTLTAPEDAMVQSMSGLSEGSVVQPGVPLMTLLPLDAPLSVEADLDSHFSALVKVGDPVEIKFVTLPFVQYGAAQGRVTYISPESINPLVQNTPGMTPLPGGPQDLYFKMDVSLDVINLHNTIPGFRLVPGMPLEADVKTGTRTVMDFFTSKLLPVAYTGFSSP